MVAVAEFGAGFVAVRVVLSVFAGEDAGGDGVDEAACIVVTCEAGGGWIGRWDGDGC